MLKFYRIAAKPPKRFGVLSLVKNPARRKVGVDTPKQMHLATIWRQ